MLEVEVEGDILALLEEWKRKSRPHQKHQFLVNELDEYLQTCHSLGNRKMQVTVVRDLAVSHEVNKKCHGKTKRPVTFRQE